MLLEGSCHCGAVRFSVESATPYPFMLCYCGICRKTAGTGGYAINLGADASTLRIEGEENLSAYNAVLHERGETDEQRSTARRNFCSQCGAALWLYEPSDPELVHPHASAVDTPLPEPPEVTRIMLASRAPWVQIPEGANERHFDGYPDESLEQWHLRHGLYDV
ncbi:MAG: GFA family protein [Rubrobacter sp.]|nr:GFA family protein [Rubrobacter sp.]